MLPVVEAHVDSVMHEPFAFQAFSNACFDHHVHSALLEHACANAVFDVMPAAGFHDDGIDSLQVKQVRKQQSRRPRSDNSDLRAQVLPLDGCQVREERLEFRRAKRRLSTALIAVKNLVWGREENYSLATGRKTAIAKCASSGAPSSSCSQRTTQLSFKYFPTRASPMPRCSASFSFRFAPSRLLRPLRSRFPIPTRNVWQDSM